MASHSIEDIAKRKGKKEKEKKKKEGKYSALLCGIKRSVLLSRYVWLLFFATSSSEMNYDREIATGLIVDRDWAFKPEMMNFLEFSISFM